MPEKVLQTRIQVLNDTAEALAAQGTAIPKAGELVYENDTRKLKIGDGATSYADLKYFGGDSAKNFDVVPNDNEEDVAAITRIVAGAELHTGDTAIVKRDITTGKTSYTAYVYDGAWKAMDGNYRADNVYFDDDITYTVAIGTLAKPSGSAKFATKGKNVEQATSAAVSVRRRLSPMVTALHPASRHCFTSCGEKSPSGPMSSSVLRRGCNAFERSVRSVLASQYPIKRCCAVVCRSSWGSGVISAMFGMIVLSDCFIAETAILRRRSTLISRRSDRAHSTGTMLSTPISTSFSTSHSVRSICLAGATATVMSAGHTRSMVTASLIATTARRASPATSVHV